MAIDMESILTGEPTSGIETRKGFSGEPDSHGMLFQAPLVLPPFEAAAYHTNPYYWPGCGCDRHAYILRDFAREDLPAGAQFMLVRLADGRCLALLPLAGEKAYAWFAAGGGECMIQAGTHGKGVVSGDLPLLAWAVADDPYAACQEVFRAAMKSPRAAFRMREQKPYADIFRHLGWCSWEEFFGGINHENMAAVLQAMNESPIPVRYALLDDGHQDFSNENEYWTRGLRSFRPNASKFPDNYASLMAQRREGGIRWLGVWSTIVGGLQGVAMENDLGDLNDDLMHVNGVGLLPKNNAASAQRFMDAMISALKSYGFDFVKIDFETWPVVLYAGGREMLKFPADNANAIDNPAEACVRLARALERAVTDHDMQILNCNGVGSLNLLNNADSNSTRCSGDYSKGNRDSAGSHLLHSYSIIPWLGQICWGDHDMFHSCDPVSGRAMAVAKAVSGGPVYLSDNPKDFVPEHIRPLCYDTGELLRPLAPAAPLPDGLFVDPIDSRAPYRVIAPLAGGAAAVVLYNLCKDGDDMRTAVSPQDYTHAGCMMQPLPDPWAVPAEGLVVWDWHEGRGKKLTGEHAVTLGPLEDRLLLLAPIREGWAVIGRTDKFLSPVAVTVNKATAKQLQLTFVESGPLTIYSSAGAPKADGLTCADLGGGFWRADMPVGDTGRKLTVQR